MYTYMYAYIHLYTPTIIIAIQTIGGKSMKLSVTMAYATTILSWGLLEYEQAYKDTGQYQHMLDSLRWPLDYFIKSHVSDEQFYYQVTITFYRVTVYLYCCRNEL